MRARTRACAANSGCSVNINQMSESSKHTHKRKYQNVKLEEGEETPEGRRVWLRLGSKGVESLPSGLRLLLTSGVTALITSVILAKENGLQTAKKGCCRCGNWKHFQVQAQ